MAKISDTSAYPNISALDGADYFIITDAENKFMTKSCTINQMQSLFGIDTNVAHVTVNSSSLLTLPSTPVTLIAAPGANKVLDIMSVMFYLDAGVQYNFTANLELDLDSTVLATLPFASLNSGTDKIDKVLVKSAASILSLSANQPLMLQGGGTVGAGTGIAYFNIFYRVLDVGSTF